MSYFVCANNIIGRFRKTIGDYINLNDVHRLLARYGCKPVYTDPKRGPMYRYDSGDDIYTKSVDSVLNQIFWDIKDGKFVFKYPEDRKNTVTKTETKPQKHQPSQMDIPFVDENLHRYTKKEFINESKKKVVKNDDGQIVPEFCPECGSKVGLYLKGEPVYLCSNKKCNKYFGTVPFSKNLYEEKYIENDYGEKWERQSANSDIFKTINSKIDSNNKSDIGLMDVAKVDGGSHYIAILHGGLNGSGKWEKYIKDIAKIIKNIPGSYVIDLDVDVLDDVWTLQLGFHKEKLNEGAWGVKPEESDSYLDLSHELGEPVIKILSEKLPKYVNNPKDNDGNIYYWLGLMLDMLKIRAFGESWLYCSMEDEKYKMIRDLFSSANKGFDYLMTDTEKENRQGWEDFVEYRKHLKKMHDEFKKLEDYYNMDKDIPIGTDKLIHETKMKAKRKKVFVTESQYNYIKDIINEGKFPVDPNKVLVVKKFLDKNFTKGGISSIGEDGYPKTISIVALKGNDGGILKNMNDKQLFYMLQDKFQHLYSDTVRRDNLLKQIIKDWYKNRISKDGILTVNFI